MILQQNIDIIQNEKNLPNELNGNISFNPVQKRVIVDNNFINYFEDFYLTNVPIYSILLNDLNNFQNDHIFCFGQKYNFLIIGNDFEIGILNDKGIFSPQYHIKMVNDNVSMNEIHAINNNSLEEFSFYTK